MSAIEMRKLMEAISHISESSTLELLSQEIPLEMMGDRELEYWYAELGNEYKRLKAEGNDDYRVVYATRIKISNLLDERNEPDDYEPDDRFDDPHGDHDKSPEELAGEVWQDKYDMYRNEY